MNRTALLSSLAMMLTTSPSFAQPQGIGGMMGGMGGMGGQGMASGTMMRGGGGFGGGGGFVGAGFPEIRRSVEVEMEGGHRLSGKIDFRPIIVDGDLGRYTITPDKIKMMRFLKPANEAEGQGNEEGGAGAGAAVVPAGLQNQGAAIRAARGARGGFGGGMADRDPQTGATLTRGKVITMTDQDIIGTVHIPADFRLVLDYGTLNLAPAKLRSITVMGANRQDKPAPADAAAPRSPDDAGQVTPADAASSPRYFRQGSSLIVVSPVGDRVTLFDIETKRSQSLELSGSKDAPLEVTPIVAENIIALTLKGSKITLIAVADTASGIWHSQGLRAPIDGQAVPIVASGVVVYILGRQVYAYGALAQRWDVADLAEGVRAMPVVGPGTATIENNGHIYTFAGKSGKWEQVDVRAILDPGGATKK